MPSAQPETAVLINPVPALTAVYMRGTSYAFLRCAVKMLTGDFGVSRMSFHATLRSERFTFADLREVFAKANEEKSGDQLAGIAARSERERVAAKIVLADVRLEEIAAQPLIDPEIDDVSRLLWDTHDRARFGPLQ